MLSRGQVVVILLAFGLVFPIPSYADDIDDFINTWTGQALIRQRLIDIDSPLANSNIIGTHNSFNSSVYGGAFSYPDPNQVDSIFNQLRMGSRNIELDVHWTPKQEGPFSFPNRLLLCHGTSSHLGCSTSDRYLAEGLDEIQAWLNSPASDNQVLLLHIEDHMDGQNGEAFNQINARFGNYIYTSGGCHEIPSSLTKANVLNIGKKIVVWTDGGCSGDANWNGMVFSGLGAISRIWEDSTTVGGIAGSGAVILYNDVVNSFANGINLIDLDQLHQNDSRLEAAIWSWDVNEPNNFGGNENCAIQHANGRWNDDNCENEYAFACQHTPSGNWAISSLVGTWGIGALACNGLGTDYQFNRPTDSQSNQSLKLAKEASGQTSLWLNHDDRSAEGSWTTSHTSDVFFSAGSLSLSAGQTVSGLTRLLKMELDCNLVLYSVNDGVVGGNLWSSGTSGAGDDCETHFQGDGNLVVYDGSGQALWHSSTSGAELRIQADGNAVIYHIGGSALWQTFTNYPSIYTLFAGQFTLSTGQMLHSENRKLEMRSDCNLVLYSFENGTPGGILWQSNTTGAGNNCYADFQADGNFVVYDNIGQYLWASGTSGTSNAELRLQADGNLVVYNGGNQPLWGANTNIPSQFIFDAGNFTLQSGQYVQSQNRKLKIQNDCNLVLYNVVNALVGGPLWSSNTQASGTGCYADFQADGNFVVYNEFQQPLWASGTSGTSGAQIWLQDDGNIVLYNGAGLPLWTTNTPGDFVSQSYCGDLTCGGSETCSTCSADCGSCTGGETPEVPALSASGMAILLLVISGFALMLRFSQPPRYSNRDGENH